MADEEKPRAPEPPREKPRIIDVTKPKSQPKPTPISHIDATRVSAYTLKEQQALEKLKRQVGNLNQRENRMSKIKTIVAIILVILLIALAVLFIIVIGNTAPTEEENYDVRVSIEIENKSALSVITDYGKEQLRQINPGDTVPLSAVVSNSSDPRGDIHQDTLTPPAIYVRFKLLLKLDYEDRYDILIPTLSSKWHRYNKEEEDEIITSTPVEDDHYYYYKGVLSFNNKTELFSALTFDGNVLTCEDGGKYGQIQVLVESIEANINAISSENIWPTAPKRWILDMVDGKYN